jgi:endonuclease/exonuclease/phosphatase family metal-dependent hydrolase
MKIATWNIERLKHHARLNLITDAIDHLQADICILTETDSRVKTKNYTHCITTSSLELHRPGYYKATENRVTILTNYEVVNQYPTYDQYTSLCVALKTPSGNLLVYGTIIGIYGNRNPNFKEDLVQQMNDIEKLAPGNNFCLGGDYNLSFCDNYYYTNFGRREIEKSFEKNKIKLLTGQVENCIDHIAVSADFFKSQEKSPFEWNKSKTLSDHKGICVTIF